MTATFSIIERWREWEPNPVLLKELRQAVRSQALTGVLLAVLAVLFLASSAVLVRADGQTIMEQQIGKLLFRTFLFILTPISLVFVPLYIGIRLSLERKASDLDLMFITALRPERIIRGKLFCGAYLVGIFFSVFTPFMLFTNQLRGVDLPTVVLILVYLFVSACLAIEISICFACLPFQMAFKVICGLVLAFALAFGAWGLLQFFLSIVRSGAATMMGSSRAWIGFAGMMVVAFAVMGFMHVMAISLVEVDSRPRGYFNEVIKV